MQQHKTKELANIRTLNDGKICSPELILQDPVVMSVVWHTTVSNSPLVQGQACSI